MLSFYEQKIAQLKEVLQRQSETKKDLMSELTSLTHENKKQNGYVNQLKTIMDHNSEAQRKGIKSSQHLISA